MARKSSKNNAASVKARKASVRETLEDAKDVREARKALQHMKAKGEKPIPFSQVKKELGL